MSGLFSSTNVSEVILRRLCSAPSVNEKSLLNSVCIKIWFVWSTNSTSACLT